MYYYELLTYINLNKNKNEKSLIENIMTVVLFFHVYPRQRKGMREKDTHTHTHGGRLDNNTLIANEIFSIRLNAVCRTVTISPITYRYYTVDIRYNT